MIAEILTIATIMQGCPDCGVSFHPSDTLGGPEDPGSPGPIAEVFRMNDGRFLMSAEVMGPLVVVYGADGSYEGVLGREGQGPGEFQTAVRFSESIDGVLVHQLRTNRFSEFDEQLLYLRGFATPSTAWGMVQAPDSSWFVAAPLPSAGDSTYVVQRFSPGGERLGTMLKAETTSGLERLVYRISIDSDGYLWVVAYNGYVWVMEQSGSLLAEFQIPGRDMGKPIGRRMPRGQRRPAQIMDVVPGLVEGTMLVYSLEQDENFDSSRLRITLPPPEEVQDVVVYELKRSDSEVEVVSSTRFDTLLRGLSDGWAYDLVEDPGGYRRIRVGRLKPMR